jgi:hypothetical protein
MVQQPSIQSTTTSSVLSHALAMKLQEILVRHFRVEKQKEAAAGNSSMASAFQAAVSNLQYSRPEDLHAIFQGMSPLISGADKKRILVAVMNEFKSAESVIRTAYLQQLQAPPMFPVQLPTTIPPAAPLLSKIVLESCLRRLTTHSILFILRSYEQKASAAENYVDAAAFQLARITACIHADNHDAWMRDLLTTITEAELDVVIMEIKQRCEQNKAPFLERGPTDRNTAPSSPWVNIRRPQNFRPFDRLSFDDASFRLRRALHVDTAFALELKELKGVSLVGYYDRTLDPGTRYRALTDALERASTIADLQAICKSNNVLDSERLGLLLNVLQKRLASESILPQLAPFAPNQGSVAIAPAAKNSN